MKMSCTYFKQEMEEMKITASEEHEDCNAHTPE
jgi:hypothetical protein